MSAEGSLEQNSLKNGPVLRFYRSQKRWVKDPGLVLIKRPGATSSSAYPLPKGAVAFKHPLLRWLSFLNPRRFNSP